MAKDKEIFKLYHVETYYPYRLVANNAYETASQYRIPWTSHYIGGENYNLVRKDDPAYSKDPRAAVEAFVAKRKIELDNAEKAVAQARLNYEEAELLLRDFDAGLVTAEQDD